MCEKKTRCFDGCIWSNVLSDQSFTVTVCILLSSSPRWWKFLIHPPQLASQQSSITGQPTYPSHKNTIITLNIVALHTQTWRSLWISHLNPSNLELQSNCACGAFIRTKSQESRGKHDVTHVFHGMGFCMLLVSRRGLDVYIWAPKWLEISGWGVDSMNILVSPKLLKSNSWSATLRSFWFNLVFG